MRKKRNRPPMLASWMLNTSSMAYQKTSALGDLDEMFNEMCKDHGIRTARRWYWNQVLKSIPHSMHQSLLWGGGLFKSFVKVTLRSIDRFRLYSGVNIVGLTVGMACACLIFMWSQFEFSYDRFHKNADRIHRVVFATDPDLKTDTGFHGEWQPGVLAPFLSQEYPEIEAATSIGSESHKLSVNENHIIADGCFVHPSFFRIFTFSILEGDAENPFPSPLSIVLTKDMAMRFFGETSVVGKSVIVDNRFPLVVTAVMDNVPVNSTFQFDFLLSFIVAPRHMQVWDNKATTSYVLLDPQASADEVSQKIKNVYNDHNIGGFPNYLYLQSLGRVHLHQLEGGGRINTITMFMTLGAVILLLSCINFMNLTTACASNRMREIGMKKVMGASKIYMVLQFLSEAIVLSILSMILAVILVYLLLPASNILLGITLPMRFSWNLLLGILGITLLTGLVAGSYPAFFLSALQPTVILRRSNRSVYTRPSTVRRLLVITQFTVTAGFLAAVLIIQNQISYYQKKDLGFDKKDVVVLQMNAGAGRQMAAIKEELSKHPNIIGATATMNPMSYWTSTSDLKVQGKEVPLRLDIGRNHVDFDFLTTMNMSMAQGRFFSREFPTDAQNACVINETLARIAGLENPLGAVVAWAPDGPYEIRRTVVGVIKDYHSETLHIPIRPLILFPGQYGPYLFVRIRPVEIEKTLEYIRVTIQALVPQYTFDYHFLTDELKGLYKEDVTTARFVAYLTGIAIILGCLGLFGLASFATERRIKEIGIRKILGASIRRILIMMSRECVVLVLIANFLAIPIVWFIMNKWLQNFANRTIIGWIPFAIAILCTSLVAWVTSTVQVIRAARSNPVEVLRYE